MGSSTKEQVPPDTLDNTRLLSRDEAIGFLGVSLSTLQKLALRKNNPVPSIRLGKCRRYPFDELRAWIKNQGK